MNLNEVLGNFDDLQEFLKVSNLCKSVVQFELNKTYLGGIIDTYGKTLNSV
jgi:hypothetical protein